MTKGGRVHGIRIKLLYFMLFLAFGMSSPYSAIFYRHTLTRPDGTTDLNLIGLIYAAMPFVGLVTSMCAGVVADALRLGRRLITICCFGASVFSFAIAWGVGDLALHWSLAAKFSLLFALLAAMTVFNSPVGSLLDAETLRFLNTENRREDYGSHRLWGTLGWAVGTPIMGWLLMKFPPAIMFYAMSVGSFLMGIASIGGVEATLKRTREPIQWNRLLKDKTFLLFLIFLFFYGMVMSATSNFFSYFFEDVMHSSFETGIIFCVWTFLEIPIMYWGAKLVSKFGPRKLLLAGLICGIVRYILFSFFTIDTPFVYKFLASLVHGPAFGLTFLGLMHFLDQRAHQTMKATYVSISSMVQGSFAASLGGWLGSVIMGSFGGRGMMLFSALTFAGLFVFILVFVKLPAETDVVK